LNFTFTNNNKRREEEKKTEKKKKEEVKKVSAVVRKLSNQDSANIFRNMYFCIYGVDFNVKQGLMKLIMSNGGRYSYLVSNRVIDECSAFRIFKTNKEDVDYVCNCHSRRSCSKIFRH